MKGINFYKDRICLNCLTNSLENATEIWEVMGGYVLIGLLSANYPNAQSGIKDMKRYQEVLNNHISVGLGAGNPDQWQAVAEISAELKPGHINQTFTGGGYTRAQAGAQSIMNSMVEPCGQVGFVKISTGPISKDLPAAVVPVETAIAMAKEMGADSLKYFPMGGLKVRDEYWAVARACAQSGFGLEPTGGIDLKNFEEILRIAVDAGVKKIIPHVYSSIIDKSTGATRIGDLKVLFEMIRRVLA